MNLPTGTVTLLFTDIEGSTRLWDAHPQAMAAALRRHDSLIREAIEANGGLVFKTVGDAFCAVFSTALHALTATLAAQRALTSESWPEPIQIRVRMALHTGTAEERDGDYFGPPLNRVARLLSLGHGGQALLSRPTQELVQDNLPPQATLVDLGQHHLRDLSRAEQVFQLLYPDLPCEFPPLKSLDHLPNNLPRQLTSFIGRDQEMAEVKALLEKSSLLTLTGSGGCGKTRLALQVAGDVLDCYTDGVWLVELASLADPDLVTQSVASVLGLREQSGKPLAQTLQEFLKSKHLLLLLDNCEHLLDSCARLSDILLKNCPQVTIFISSREALGITEEQTYRVPSLSLPPGHARTTPESLAQYEAVRLFIERATAVQPQFALTAANAPLLAQACRHLDGIPLAIELAAARVRSLSVEEINTRLDDRFRLLTRGSRTALPRHQTLRALIDWSYDLLNDREKILLHRLSVFAGGWTLDAAGSVCVGGEIEEWEVLDLLTSLVDKSLVVAEVQGERTRYRLLAMVHQYAQDRLVESGESEAARERHRGYFLALAEEAAPKLTSAQQAEWLQRLEEEHDNLRVALMWDNQGEVPLRITVALARFWLVRGYLREGRERLASALAGAGAQGRTLVRAKALNAAGALTYSEGDFATARTLFAESLVLFRELRDIGGIAHSLQNLGNVAYAQGDYSSAPTLYEESLALQRELGNHHGIANSLNNLGAVAKDRGDHARARMLYEESLALYRELGDSQGITTALNNLGEVLHAQGDLVAARTWHQESLVLCRELGYKRGITYALNNLGTVAKDEGDYVSARLLVEESLALRRELGDKQGVAGSLNSLGEVAKDQGDYLAAHRSYEESLALYRELGDKRGVASSLGNLGNVALERHDYPAARMLYEQSLTLFRQLGDKRATAEVLDSFAALAAAQGQPERATHLWGASEILREEIGAPLPPADRPRYDHQVAAVRAEMGEKAFAPTWEKGRAMTMEQAIEYAIEEAEP